MSTKTVNKASVGKKENSKKAASPPNVKAEKHPEKHGEKIEKTEKKEARIPEQDEVLAAPPAMSADELEEMEEIAEEAAATSSANSGNAAALAAAAGSPTEMSASFKNFRHHPDMENFYRFIFENDLRHEALAIIDDVLAEKQQRKIVKNSKAQPH